MIDPAAPAEERAERRRRLFKGPPECRQHRLDLPKAKKLQQTRTALILASLPLKAAGA
jgi:hypothetical protein